jgi:hypothetical protein
MEAKMSTSNTLEIPSAFSFDEAMKAAMEGKPWALYMEIKAIFKGKECYKFWSICGIGEGEAIQSHHGKVGCTGVRNLHFFGNLHSLLNQKWKVISARGHLYEHHIAPVLYYYDTTSFNNYEHFQNELVKRRAKAEEKAAKKEAAAKAKAEKAAKKKKTAPKTLPAPPPPKEKKPLVDPTLEGKARLRALSKARRKKSEW